MSEFALTLRVDEIARRVRLSLDGLCSAEGPTLQELADELVWKMLVTVWRFAVAVAAASASWVGPTSTGADVSANRPLRLLSLRGSSLTSA